MNPVIDRLKSRKSELLAELELAKLEGNKELERHIKFDLTTIEIYIKKEQS